MAPENDPVSREAHDRMVRERDEFRKKAEELELVVRDYGTRERAIDHLRSKGISDPGHWATVAMPHLRDKSPEELGVALDELFTGLPVSSTPSPAPPPPPSPFTRGPNPGAGGETPSPEALKPGSPEWRQVLKKDGLEGLRRLDKEGRVAWSSENLKWQGLAQ